MIISCTHTDTHIHTLQWNIHTTHIQGDMIWQNEIKIRKKETNNFNNNNNIIYWHRPGHCIVVQHKIIKTISYIKTIMSIGNFSLHTVNHKQ